MSDKDVGIGLFPHDWIISAHEEHSNWFTSFDTDVEGVLRPFTVKSNSHKEQLRNYLKSKAIESGSLDWCSRFITVFDVVENALKGRFEIVYGK
ncbi:hypothetical protein [Shewanella glacialipiscicola]|uniref:hypothetical protein n=1 Tax=Shewanella glacialipiscicola TaxID=614069 RepID=UPI0021D9249D|nr:hypothetical protein [Shewanella glacialipiscicola]MCU7996447.1 hypothetical protein [Shewanella glacialipiscicola]MCU8027760.1 hypothetical protein [Shewanella glacialipiscicola]